MKNKNLLPFAILLILSFQTTAQNLVTNGDFSIKEGSGCPDGTGLHANKKPLGWDDDTHPRQHSPDYFHPCNPNGASYSPGDNVNGCADPLSGTAYVGINVYNKNQFPTDLNTEYIHQQLSTPLTINQAYYIEFYVSAADDAELNVWVRKIGMYLSTGIGTYAPGPNDLYGFHHLENSVQIPNNWPGSAISTMNGWYKISGTYTPNVSGVKHILIGYFDLGVNSGNPDITFRSSQQVDNGYYYIDAVSITPIGQSPPPVGPQISGPDYVCNGTLSTFTLSDYPPGADVSWQVSPSNLVTPSSGPGAIASFQESQPEVRGSTTITFEIQGNCDTQLKQETFWTGHPDEIIGTLSGPSTVSVGSLNNYSVPDQWHWSGTFDWTTPLGHLQTAGGDGQNYVQTWIQSYAVNGYVQIWRTNTCGNGGARYKWVTVTGQGGCSRICEMSIGPNPAFGSVTIQYLDKEGQPLAEGRFELDIKYTIKDLDGSIVLTNRSNLTKLTLDLSPINKRGVYILEVAGENADEFKAYRLLIDR